MAISTSSGAIGAATDVGMGFLNQRFASGSADKAKNLQRYFNLQTPRQHVWGLRAAGLNPILAAGGKGSAGAPNVGHGSVGTGATSAGVGSALQARRLVAELENIEADTMKKHEERWRATAEGWNAHYRGKIAEQGVASAKAAAARAKADQELWDSEFGRTMRKIELFFQTINPFASSARDLGSAYGNTQKRGPRRK